MYINVTKGKKRRCFLFTSSQKTGKNGVFALLLLIEIIFVIPTEQSEWSVSHVKCHTERSSCVVECISYKLEILPQPVKKAVVRMTKK